MADIVMKVQFLPFAEIGNQMKNLFIFSSGSRGKEAGERE
jgi:hypothetical protein